MSKLTARELWNSSEFKAFCELLGIPNYLATTRMVITIDMDEAVKVDHTYLPDRPTETSSASP